MNGKELVVDWRTAVADQSTSPSRRPASETETNNNNNNNNNNNSNNRETVAHFLVVSCRPLHRSSIELTVSRTGAAADGKFLHLGQTGHGKRNETKTESMPNEIVIKKRNTRVVDRSRVLVLVLVVVRGKRAVDKRP